MIVGIIISGCSHTSKVRTNGIEILWREYQSQEWGFLGFCLNPCQFVRFVFKKEISGVSVLSV